MIASERLLYIMSSLKTKGIINLKDISQELHISEITVRRDFERLEREGRLKRVPGGATRIGDLEDLMQEDDELTIDRKNALHQQEKNSVAQYAATLVSDGACVFLDSGTSMLPLAELLAKRRVRLVTFNDLIVRRLKCPEAELFVLGGQFIPRYGLYSGPMTEYALAQFHFDTAFFSASGIDLEQDAVYATETVSLAARHKALEVSERSYLLLDSSKLTQRGFVKLAGLSAFQAAICNHCESERPLPENFILV